MQQFYLVLLPGVLWLQAKGGKETYVSFEEMRLLQRLSRMMTQRLFTRVVQQPYGVLKVLHQSWNANVISFQQNMIIYVQIYLSSSTVKIGG